MFQTDSEEVLCWKDAKDFENRVKKCLKLIEWKWVGPVLLDEVGAWRWHSRQWSGFLLALSLRASPLVNQTFCVGRTLYQCVSTHLVIYKWTAFKRQVDEVTVHCCCSILGVRF